MSRKTETEMHIERMRKTDAVAQLSATGKLQDKAKRAKMERVYEKLDVNNSTEAVLKSYRLGIIEKSPANE